MDGVEHGERFVLGGRKETEVVRGVEGGQSSVFTGAEKADFK